MSVSRSHIPGEVKSCLIRMMLNIYHSAFLIVSKPIRCNEIAWAKFINFQYFRHYLNTQKMRCQKKCCFISTNVPGAERATSQTSWSYPAAEPAYRQWFSLSSAHSPEESAALSPDCLSGIEDCPEHEKTIPMLIQAGWDSMRFNEIYSWAPPSNWRPPVGIS